MNASKRDDYLTLPGLEHPAAFHVFGTRRLASATHLEPVRSVVKVRQVHGDVVVRVGDRPLSEAPTGDALITDRPGILVTVTTADCTPVLLLDPEHLAVAAIHAGWRGTLSGIAAKTVRAMIETFGADPAHLRAGIGPTIGPCCYEVGQEVWEAVEERHPYAARALSHLPDRTGKAMLDLACVNRLQLIEVGLNPGHVHAVNRCTACGRDDFYSYRRNGGIVGSLISGILIRLP